MTKSSSSNNKKSTRTSMTKQFCDQKDGIIILSDDVADVHEIKDDEDDENTNNHVREPPRRRCCSCWCRRYCYWIILLLAVATAGLYLQKDMIIQYAKDHHYLSSNDNDFDDDDDTDVVHSNDDDSAIEEKIVSQPVDVTMLDGTKLKKNSNTSSGTIGGLNSGLKTIPANESSKSTSTSNNHDVIVNTTSNNGAIDNEEDTDDDDTEDDQIVNSTTSTAMSSVLAKKNKPTTTTTTKTAHTHFGATNFTGPVHVKNPDTQNVVISRYGTNYTLRSQRFPSIQQRIQFYMSNWYLPPCSKTDLSSIKYSHEIIQHDDTSSVVNGTTSHPPSSSSSSHQYIDIYNMDTFTKHKRQNVTYMISNQAVVTGDLFYFDKANLVTNIAPQKSSTSTGSSTFDIQVGVCSQELLDTVLPAMQRIHWNPHNHKDLPPLLVQCHQGNKLKQEQQKSTTKKKPVQGLYEIDIPYLARSRFSIRYEDINFISMNGHESGQKNLNDCTSTTRLTPALAATTHDHYIPSTLQPILWKFFSKKLYQDLQDINMLDTIPYKDKNDLAVFRGSIGTSTSWNESLSDEENCRSIPKCNLVLTTATSKFIDARLVKPFDRTHPKSIKLTTTSTTPSSSSNKNNTRMLLTNSSSSSNNATAAMTTTTTTPKPTISETKPTEIFLNGTALSLKQLVRNKMLILMEDTISATNMLTDDASFHHQLLVAMYSSTVVVMPNPITTTSWMMEELLEPYVHYVPIKSDLSDIEHIVHWILHHPHEVQYISFRARLWIEDLLFHPDSQKDEHKIQSTILTRYQSLFNRM